MSQGMERRVRSVSALNFKTFLILFDTKLSVRATLPLQFLVLKVEIIGIVTYPRKG